MARRRSGAKSQKPRSRKLAEGFPRAIAGLGAESGRDVAKPGEEAEPEALVVTWWFDSGEAGEPYSATVRFTGRRVDTRGNPKARDTFTKDETIEGIVPGTGPVSITTWAYGLEPGEWNVHAELTNVRSGTAGARPGFRSKPGGLRSMRPARWSWRRWAISSREPAPVKTRWAVLAPLALQPAVLPGIYTALAIVGFVLALALQAAILAAQDVPVGPPLAGSIIALVAGLVGAKAWYAVLHPEESIIRGGWAVDGFVVTFPLVAAATLLAFDAPIGIVLDATTPGLFFAVAIGRVGCFFTGCCAGRCTGSRWGIWSSDRRVGARRIPTQLLEAGAGALIAIVSVPVVLADALPVHGSVFVAAFIVYAAVRQVLLRLRAEQRKSLRTLPITAVAAGLVAIVVETLAVVQGR